MKKFKVLLMVVFGLGLLTLPSASVLAGGAPPILISASATTATAGNSVTLTLNNPDTRDTSPLCVTIESGSGSVSPSELTPDGNGNATFTLTSATAGTVTVKGATMGAIDENGDYECGFWPSDPLSITFTTPPPTPVSSTPKTTTKSTPSPAPTNTVTLPAASGITLWNGTNFGQSGQTFSGSTSATTSIGLADKNNTPLAIVNVNLSSAQNWSSTAITYASDATTHKAFVHGLTSAPGVVGGTFTLYVPYGANDTYVGICSGATALTAVTSNCANVYYLSRGQTKTHADSSAIPGGDTVSASIVTIGANKYWAVSGLTGTGGFSTPTIPVQQPTATVTTPTAKKSSKTAAHIVGGAVLLVLVVVGATYKWWIGKVRHLFKRDKPTTPEPPVVPPTATPDT